MRKSSTPRVELQLFLTLIFLTLTGCKMTSATEQVRPRDQTLRLFEPHMADFVCQIEAQTVPPIDAQADEWFREAQALQAPDRLVEPDYSRVVQLTRLAAERRHWKAMLNLATLYLEERDPQHGVDDAVKLVEDGMRLGIPAAYDRMGTYFANGTGVNTDHTRAYAFWQKAAVMGNPQAMAFLAEKMRAGKDGAIPGYWANIPVATKMLECSLAQGFGPAADPLHYIYQKPRAKDGTVIGQMNSETKSRAVNVLHEGVKLGCGDCASNLEIEFSRPFDLAEMIAPFIDKARGERYRVFAKELSFNPFNRFPNLDKVLPLPPATLPPWNGDRDTLLAAAMGVSLPLTPGKNGVAAPRLTRQYLHEDYDLRLVGETTDQPCAPFSGYWRPTFPQLDDSQRSQLGAIGPGLYNMDEPFEKFQLRCGNDSITVHGAVWEYWITVRHNHGAVDPQSVAGLTRQLPPEEFPRCIGSEPCPANGIWQPWLSVDHPMRHAVNQPWRQRWLLKGQAFPDPEVDWLLPVASPDLQWRLLDPSPIDIASFRS
jgi:hypothetical protein